jgi:hypothetical protein
MENEGKRKTDIEFDDATNGTQVRAAGVGEVRLNCVAKRYNAMLTSCPPRAAAVDRQRTGEVDAVQKIGGKSSRENQRSEVFEFHEHNLFDVESAVHNQRHEALACVLQKVKGDRGQLAFGNVDGPGAALGCHERKWTISSAINNAARIRIDCLFGTEGVLTAAAIVTRTA